MASQMTIDMELRFIDNASGQAKNASRNFDNIEKEAKEAGKAVDELSKKKAKPTVDADSSRADRKLSKLDSVLKKLGAKKTKTTVDANDKASEKLKKVLNKAREWSGKTFTAMTKLKDSNAVQTLTKINNSARNIAGKTWTSIVKIRDLATAPLRGIKNMLFSIKSLVLAITAGLAAKQLIANPIGLADQYSSAKIGFSTLLGESAGQQMMNDLDAFAKATPFKSSEVISQTQRMIAMGWDAESIIEDMTTIGDAAAATGKGEQGLQQIVTALAQIKTKGKLSTEELNQLAEAGVSAKRYIAEGLGYGSGDEGIAKMTEDLEDGAISSGKALEALLSGMKEYKGMMDKTANETVSGLWSQIEDTFEINIARRWGQGLQDGAKRSFGSIVELIDKADGALEEFGDTVYEVGKNISNWAADKLENAVERITEITGSYEFKNASLGEKLSMLWNGVIVDPLKEWWEGGGQEKTAETAGEIGEWMGKTITDGLLALFGVTDILDPEDAKKLGEEGGMSIAQSFAEGFKNNFDGSAITSAFVDAIGDVWGALPFWAKILIGGYGASKLAIGGANLISAVGNIGTGVLNTIGSFSIASSAFPHLTSAGSGILGLLGKTGVALGASTTGGALLTGAGGIAGGVSAISGAYDLYKSYKSYNDDKVESNARLASGASKLTGVAAGAMIGSIAGPIGALIGAGIGGVAGWFIGGKAADDIRAAKYETEGLAKAMKKAETEEEKAAILAKAKWENATEHFGDIKLSLTEIQRLANQIVWGEDLSNFEKFSSAVQQTEANLQSMKTAAEQTDRWMWKAGLGVKFNDDEIKNIKKSFDDYISSAKSYVENKHYEFTAAVSLLVDPESEGGKSIIDTGNAFYTSLQNQLDELGGKLSSSVEIALEDGVITLNEQKEIANLQQQIADITNKLANAEQQAQIELIKVKFGNGNLDYDSFETFMSTMQTTIDQRMAANDKAFIASVSSLKLQLEEGAISQEEYDKQLQTLIDGYNSSNATLKAEIKNVELQMIGEAYDDVLGEDAVDDLNNALQHAIDNGLKPIEISDKKMAELLNIELDGNGETISNIKDMLNGVFDQLGLIPVEVDGEIYFKATGKSNIEEQVDGVVPDKVESTVEVGITAEKSINNKVEILAEEFGIKESEACSILWNLSGKKTVLEKVSYLAEEFGINESEAATVLWKLTGDKGIMNKISLGAGDFGIKSSYTFNPTVNISPIKGTVTPIRFSSHGLATQEYRGGIVGGSSSMEAFARGGIAGYSDGGMVRGGAKLITVAEEGSPEMIIPLSSQRRDRALELWAKAGEMLGIRGFARGGRTDGGADEGIRFMRYGSDESAGGQSVHVEVGGVKVDIHVNAGTPESVAEAIRQQANDITETVAGIMADAFGGQFENTPVRGGA